MIKIRKFTFNALQENTYLLYDETGEGVIIDPGCYEKYEQEELTEFIEKEDISLKFLLNTHCHVDHVLGNYFIKQKYKVPLLIHEVELPILKAVDNYAPVYGFYSYSPEQPDQFITEGTQILFGNSSLEILFVPGHSPGHVAFYNLKEGFCISGDVLFYRSIGRTDLPGGNFDTLMKTIRNKMFSLPGNMIVYPGHGPQTTIIDEMNFNPFCAVK